MSFMKRIISEIERILGEVEKNHGIKKSRLLLDVGIDPAQYRAYVRDDRVFSDTMLQRFAKSPYIGIKYDDLKAITALDEYTPEQLAAAQKLLENYPNFVTSNLSEAVEIAKAVKAKKMKEQEEK